MTLPKTYNTFDFIGELGIPKDDNGFYQIKDNGKGWEGHRLNLAIKESNINSQFIELYGGLFTNKENKVLTFSKSTEAFKGSKIEIPWSDRLKGETLDMVADFRKIVVDLETNFEKKKEYSKLLYDIRRKEYEGVETEDEKENLKKNKAKFKELATNRYEFISEYDAVMFLANNLKDFTKHKFQVKGSVVLNEYKGVCRRKFVPESIEIVPDDTLNKLRMKVSIFFQDNAIDAQDMEQDKKVYVEGFLSSYDRDSKSDKLFPQTFIINTEKMDMENETHLKLLSVLKDSFKTNNNNLHYLEWEVNAYRGAEKEEITIEDLTDHQKKMIELNLAQIEEFVQSGGKLGENIDELRLVRPLFMGKFDDGAIDLDISDDEVGELIIKSTASVKLEDEIRTEKEEKQEDKSSKVKDTMESLFG